MGPNLASRGRGFSRQEVGRGGIAVRRTF